MNRAHELPPRRASAFAWTLIAAALCASCVRSTPASTTPRLDAHHTLSSGALLARGRELLRRGDGVRAEQYLTLAVRAGAPESLAIVPLVQACVTSSRLQSALEHARPYLQRHPDAWRLRYLVAAIQLALGRTDRALVELARVQRDRPDAVGPHYLAAVIARDQLADSRAASASFAAYLLHAPHGEHAAEARAFLRERSTDGTAPAPGAPR